MLAKVSTIHYRFKVARTANLQVGFLLSLNLFGLEVQKKSICPCGERRCLPWVTAGSVSLVQNTHKFSRQFKRRVSLRSTSSVQDLNLSFPCSCSAVRHLFYRSSSLLIVVHSCISRCSSFRFICHFQLYRSQVCLPVTTV